MGQGGALKTPPIPKAKALSDKRQRSLQGEQLIDTSLKERLTNMERPEMNSKARVINLYLSFSSLFNQSKAKAPIYMNIDLFRVRNGVDYFSFRVNTGRKIMVEIHSFMYLFHQIQSIAIGTIRTIKTKHNH
jgi:hypothetical protein